MAPPSPRNPRRRNGRSGDGGSSSSGASGSGRGRGYAAFTTSHGSTNFPSMLPPKLPLPEPVVLPPGAGFLPSKSIMLHAETQAFTRATQPKRGSKKGGANNQRPATHDGSPAMCVLRTSGLPIGSNALVLEEKSLSGKNILINVEDEKIKNKKKNDKGYGGSHSSKKNRREKRTDGKRSDGQRDRRRKKKMDDGIDDLPVGGGEGNGGEGGEGGEGFSVEGVVSMPTSSGNKRKRSTSASSSSSSSSSSSATSFHLPSTQQTTSTSHRPIPWSYIVEHFVEL